MKAYNTKDGSLVNHSTNLKMKNILINIDSTTSPKYVCLNIEISGMTGGAFTEMAAAQHTYVITDGNNKTVPLNERVLKRIGGLMEEGIVNYTVKVPYRLKTAPAGNYTVNYVMNAGNGKKKITVVSKVK